ncbi:MAG: glutathione-disulfide reductase [Aerococcus sp.]|nr:glutathione-disulfide reductase [Aerococcus sp.]
MKTYDFIVIGGGSGGIASANRAAEYGAKSLIIEEDVVGGTCINRGCVPKKITWFGSQMMDNNRLYAEDYGFDLSLNHFDYQTLKANREAYIERTHQSYFKGFESRGTTFIKGHAEFVDDHTLRVGDNLYTASHIAIATGTRPVLPDIEGAEYAETSDDFFTWEELPQSVVLVGAGYVALEIAGMLNALGVEVTLAIRHELPMSSFDQEIVEKLVERMEASGITILRNHHAQAIQKHNDGFTLSFGEGDQVTVDHVLFAVGRRPNTDHIGIENTAIALTERGHVQVNDYHRTTVDGVYALGDVIGKTALTPVAIKAGRTLSDELFNHAEPFRLNYEGVPTVLFTHPEIGKVGLTESQAREKYADQKIKIYHSQFTTMRTGLGDHREPTVMKLIVVGEEERIVGLWGIGSDVAEMIEGFAVAIQMGATKADFDRTIAIHPTSSEEFVTMR